MLVVGGGVVKSAGISFDVMLRTNPALKARSLASY